MLRLVPTGAVTGVMLLLVLAGCSGSDEGDAPAAAPTGSPVASPSGKVLDRGQLESILLAVPDMPTGYTRSAAEDDPEDPGTVPDPEDRPTSDKPACAELFAEFQGGRTAQQSAAAGNPTAGVEYEKSDLGPFLAHQLTSYQDLSMVQSRMGKLGTAAAECAEFTVTEGSEQYTVKITPAAFPPLGDQSAAFKVVADGGAGELDLTMGGYLVGVRVGNTMATIVHFGLPDADQAETEKVARTATDKLLPLAK